MMFSKINDLAAVKIRTSHGKRRAAQEKLVNSDAPVEIKTHGQCRFAMSQL
jgi:hypothetical protein